MTDPWTQIHAALVAAMRADAKLAAMVRAGNWIDGTEGTDRYELSTTDAPEIEVMPAGGGVIASQTSTGVMAEIRFNIAVHSGEPNPRTKLFPLKWAVTRAIFNAGERLGLSFVVRTRLVDAADREIDTGFDVDGRGLGGWVTLIQARFDCQFDRTAMARPDAAAWRATEGTETEPNTLTLWFAAVLEPTGTVAHPERIEVNLGSGFVGASSAAWANNGGYPTIVATFAEAVTAGMPWRITADPGVTFGDLNTFTVPQGGNAV